jgi:hypothetical protein
MGAATAVGKAVVYELQRRKYELKNCLNLD